MKNIREEVARWTQAALFIGLWILLSYLSHDNLGFNVETANRMAHVVFIYGAIHLLFTTWLWRLRIFGGWLVPFPDTQGTWKGTLTSTWIDPTTGRPPPPIPIVLAIRQTFSSMSAAIYTRESSSFSTATSFRVDDDSHEKRVSYVYTNTPRVSVRERSVVHEGAAVLRLTTTPELTLEGEYWTNRKSTGEMTLKRISTKVTDGFQE